MSSPARWVFEQVNPSTSGSSGKIIDLFRNEGTDERGHLQEDAPPAAATLMAREVIQNSWDAAKDLHQSRPEAPPFEIDFNFEEVDSSGKERLVGALGLRELAQHAHEVAPTPEQRVNLGLGSGDCLLDLDRAPLRVCKIVERGASGMYGPWRGTESRMYLAMLSVGYNEKADGSGGTFGYGKAGLIRASHSRIVLAYSCFLEQPDDPGVTRRLLGVTYWGPHKREGISFSGFSRFGNPQGDHVVPYENEAADEVADSIGLAVRSPDVLEQLGTTFLVIDPSVEAPDLKNAVERNWWPALLDERFSVQIVDVDGTEYPCRPRKNPQLVDFVQAYDHYRAHTAPPIGRRVPLGTYSPRGGDSLDLGTLILVADPSGWSFPDDSMNAVAENRSLVALIREPRMVVEYFHRWHAAGRIPYVRGVFIAHPSVNVHLSKTEPKAHDKWDTKESDDVFGVSTRYAAEIIKRIKAEAQEFQEELRPPIDLTGAVRLARLDKQLSKLRNQPGTIPKPPPRGDRPLSYRIDVKRVPAGSGLRLLGHIDVGLSADASVDTASVRLRFVLALDEDGKRGEIVPLTIKPPDGFVQCGEDGRRYAGTLSASPVRFDLESDVYRHDWTGELLVEGEVEQPTEAPQ